jgi:uncharacterized protein YbjT (DUF2867 family)
MIVITTPTGQIGRQLPGNILGTDEPVRVIARDPARLSARARERAEVIPGSHDDPGVVAEAFAGADSVFWLVPPNGQADSVKGYYLDFTRPACEAIKSQGVQRVVGVSTLGHGYPKGAGPMTAALAMDELIESTGVSYRALAMPFFMENLLRQAEAISSQGMFFLPNSADRPFPAVATRDIAGVAARLLLDDAWSGQRRVPVAGPDDLSPSQMAQIMSEVLERPVRAQQVKAADYQAMLLQHGLSPASAQGLADMAAAQDDGAYDAEPRSPQSATPTSFHQWCAEVLKPAVLDRPAPGRR